MFTRKELRNDTDSLRPDRAGKKIDDLGTFTIVFYYNISKIFLKNGLVLGVHARHIHGKFEQGFRELGINGNYRMYLVIITTFLPREYPSYVLKCGNFNGNLGNCSSKYGNYRTYSVIIPIFLPHEFPEIWEFWIGNLGNYSSIYGNYRIYLVIIPTFLPQEFPFIVPRKVPKKGYFCSKFF